jgi:3-methylfumaryl-CoA hydratase
MSGDASGSDDSLGAWIGRTRAAEDILSERLIGQYEAALGAWLAPYSSEAAPLGMQWCLFAPDAGTAMLGPDGHPPRGDFLPPIALPRRMWAGGEMDLAAPLPRGLISRLSRIADIAKKTGGSGELIFVGIDHEYHAGDRLLARERQDLVFRAAAPSVQKRSPTPIPAVPRPGRVAASVEFEASTPLLFRYSALTFNSHRVHYDAPYAREVEGYLGLLVHGPLQATLLLNMAAVRLGAAPRRFRYRGVAPLIAGGGIRLCATEIEDGTLQLWTEADDKSVGMTAQAWL